MRLATAFNGPLRSVENSGHWKILPTLDSSVRTIITSSSSAGQLVAV